MFLVSPRASHPSLLHLPGAFTLGGDLLCDVAGRASFPLLVVHSAPRLAGLSPVYGSNIWPDAAWYPPEELTSKDLIDRKVDRPEIPSADRSSSMLREPHRLLAGAASNVGNQPKLSATAKEATPQLPQQSYALPLSALIDVPWWFHPLIQYLREAQAITGIETHSKDDPKSFVLAQGPSILLQAGVSYGKGEPWSKYLKKASAMGIIKSVSKGPTPEIRLTRRWAVGLPPTGKPLSTPATSSCSPTAAPSVPVTAVSPSTAPETVVIYGPDADLHEDTLSAVRALVHSVASFKAAAVVRAWCYGGDFFAIEMSSEMVANEFVMLVNEGRGKLTASACFRSMHVAFTERDRTTTP